MDSQLIFFRNILALFFDAFEKGSDTDCFLGFQLRCALHVGNCIWLWSIAFIILFYYFRGKNNLSLHHFTFFLFFLLFLLSFCIFTILILPLYSSFVIQTGLIADSGTDRLRSRSLWDVLLGRPPRQPHEGLLQANHPLTLQVVPSGRPQRWPPETLEVGRGSHVTWLVSFTILRMSCPQYYSWGTSHIIIIMHVRP